MKCHIAPPQGPAEMNSFAQSIPVPSDAGAALRITSQMSAEQRIWKSFRDQGVNVRAWAIEHGFNPGLVYSVLRGERKCLRGQSHDVAVALGLK
jgi:gp16 family phage-associated protein